jgi:hypothetical protein
MIAGAPVQRQETRFNPLTGQQEVQNVLSQEQGENLSNPERLALSKNLVSSLGFSKMLKYADDANDSGLLSAADRDGLFTAQQGQRFRVGDMDDDDFDDDDRFDRPAGPRENEAHDAETGVSRSARDFDEDERQVFGFNSGMYFPRNGRGEDEYFGEVPTERQSTAPSVFLGQDQRRGHQNRERTVPPAPPPSMNVGEVRGRFDPDTQAFNVDIVRPPVVPKPAPPPTARSTATRSVGKNPIGRPEKRYNKLPSVFQQRNEARGPIRYSLGERGEVRRKFNPQVEGPSLPTSQSQLPTTREGFDALAKQINAAGGINGTPIKVYAGSSVANIKKNFVKRLGLAGK